MRILSGIQPSGVLHIGNYFGMIRPAIALQSEGEALYFIADYHALTSLHDPKALREHSRARGARLPGLRARSGTRGAFPAVRRAAGRPSWRGFFPPSRRWVCSSVATPIKTRPRAGWRHRAGLFTYPVLMAADILIYDSDVVPVGKDQKQHLEVTRDIAVKINETYGEVFKLPEPRIQSATGVVPGLDGQKMSKSYGNTIDIFGDEKETRKRVMSIMTDSTPVEAPKDPESSSHLPVVFAVCRRARSCRKCATRLQRAGLATANSRNSSSPALWEYFAPMRARRAEILAQPGLHRRRPL